MGSKSERSWEGLPETGSEGSPSRKERPETGAAQTSRKLFTCSECGWAWLSESWCLPPKAGAEHSGAALTPQLQVPTRSRRPHSLRSKNCISRALGLALLLIFGFLLCVCLSLCISLSPSLSLCLSPRILQQGRLCQTLDWSTVTTDQPCVLGSFLILYSQF